MANDKTVLLQVRIFPIIIFSFIIVSFHVDKVKSDENNPHTGIQCAACHSLNEEIDVQRKNCLACHSDVEENSYLNELIFHNNYTKKCTDCHSFHDRKFIHVDSVRFQFDFSVESSKANCFACHQTNSNLQNLSDGHIKARKLYHSDIATQYELTPSQTCMACHQTRLNNYDLEFNNEKMPVVNNHPSHPYEIELVRGKGNQTNRIRFEIAPDIHLFNNRVECQTCHSLTSENEFLVANSENHSDFCTGCHEHNSNSIDLVSTQ